MWRTRLEHLLHTHDTPQRTAAAFALGVFFGFSPLLGLHTLLGLAFAFALNLNRVAVLFGVYSNLPWILPAYYTAATLAGAAILGAEVPPEFIARLRRVVDGVRGARLRPAPPRHVLCCGVDGRRDRPRIGRVPPFARRNNRPPPARCSTSRATY
jgi:uncharacterized protein (DUF2062 family)